MTIPPVVVEVMLTYHNPNEMNFYHPMRKDFRFSLWRNDDDFTAAVILDIQDADAILPGQTKQLTLELLNTKLSRSLQPAELVYIGGGTRTK